MASPGYVSGAIHPIHDLPSILGHAQQRRTAVSYSNKARRCRDTSAASVAQQEIRQITAEKHMVIKFGQSLPNHNKLCLGAVPVWTKVYLADIAIWHYNTSQD
jgi:hypothetical protein